MARIKREALETVELIRGLDPGPLTVYHWPRGHRCDVRAQNLYAGEPLLVRNLILLTENDLERLRRRIRAALREDPRLRNNVQGGVRAARRTYRNAYQVPIYHRSCGYMFHVEPGDENDGGLGWREFTPISAERAQTLLGVAALPMLVNFSGSLTPLREGYLWVAGSRAVDAFKPSKRYRIVDRTGRPVSPLETEIAPLIYSESIASSMGGPPSVSWGFQLPVRLEPLSAKP